MGRRRRIDLSDVEPDGKKKKGKGRFGNVKKVKLDDGTVFDSQSEHRRWLDLKLMERAGEIAGLTVHERFHIVIGEIPVMYASGRPLTYIADFTYTDTKTGERVVEDCKMASGHRDPIYKIKKALMLAMGYEILETQ